MGEHAAERLLNLIRALNLSGPCSVSELQKQTGCSRQAIYRFLDPLLKYGYVVRLPDQPRYRLTPAIRELSDRVRNDDVLEVIAAPILTRLQAEIVWPTSLAVFEEGMMVIRHSTRPQSPFDFDRARVGNKLPLGGTALGLAYLAFSQPAERKQALNLIPLSPADLDEFQRSLRSVRSAGYALRSGGHPQNTSSIAVPVMHQGRSQAAIVVSFLTSAIAKVNAAELFVAPLQAAAAEIEQRIASNLRES